MLRGSKWGVVRIPFAETDLTARSGRRSISRIHKKGNMIIIVMGVALVIAGSYTIVVHRYGSKSSASSHLWSWWHGFISTLVSVLLGVAVGVYMFKYQSGQTDKTQKCKLLSLLNAELSDTHRALSLPDEQKMKLIVGSTNYLVLVVYIQPLVLEEAARSNLFEPRETEEMLLTARSMKLFNLITDQLLRSATFGTGYPEDKMRFWVENQERGRKNVLGNTTSLLKQLGLRLSPTSDLPF